jgi:predicted Zn-dependent protease
MQQQFHELADSLFAGLRSDEVLLANLSAEDSQFVRFNRSAVRQPGSVRQTYLTLELIEGRRHLKATCTLDGAASDAAARARALLGELRRDLPQVPEDPHLLYAEQVRSSEQVGEDRLPDGGDVVEQILAAGRGRDLVGLYAQGGIHAGFANSLGQRNWFSCYPFGFDWCLYGEGDKAVKSSYAGFEWDGSAFAAKVASAGEQLAVLAREAKTIQPGQYRAYLAPAAMKELMETVAWHGFGLKDHRTKTTSLLRMIEGGAVLDASVTVRENTREGLAPNFQASGFLKRDEVTMIEAGRYRDCLVSPRSAREYGVEPNGASEGEYPESLDVAAGDIPRGEVLRRLGTGVWIGNLWYLNYSDRPACRITGMTRFATFWVEAGRIVAPLSVMRFDETLYRILGENLIGLTAERDLIPSSDTYERRSTDSVRVPGALVADFRFTL